MIAVTFGKLLLGKWRRNGLASPVPIRLTSGSSRRPARRRGPVSKRGKEAHLRLLSSASLPRGECSGI
jgi:hypothetical protein